MNLTPHLSRATLRDAGVSDSLALSILHRGEILRRRGFPTLYTLKHLSLSASADWGFLRSVIRRESQRAYSEFKIPKNTGGYRRISAPVAPLMQVQRWILDEILSQAPRHPDSFAYHPTIRMIEAAERHVGARWMIKADIHNFFPSISERRVYRVFKSFGYAPLLAFEMARICTWPVAGSSSSTPMQDSSVPYPVKSAGVLPQGAPTSGALANLASKDLDEQLSDFAIANHLVYSRYSDDLAFSGAGTFDRSKVVKYVREIRRLVAGNNFSMHERKLRIVSPGARKVILGMLIGHDSVRILPEQRRMLDLYIHSVRKYSLVSYAKRRKFDSPISFLNHVNGHIAHMKQIEPEWTASRESAWIEALEQAGIFPAAMS
ncbi:reverse transcriptase family protein [Curtobacterium sp. A7_M15]|uniref:reverse transcriptase family protein n=1 Tax=Curtobacterium sp. A7_M15 TaxID=3065241 RepID=UPI002737C029|nr:reverse transcriptase family protein [Curtobacterium sp. A7_M15]MDP4331764.1 reverse transcriptase family protein [Curtobacterium sp. A7_M15]